MSPARSIFAAAVALAVVACTDTPTDPVAVETDSEPQLAQGRRVVHSATGSGLFTHPSAVFNDQLRVFSFTAVEYDDGTFSGQFQLEIMESAVGSTNPAITRWLQAEVTCVTVIGNEAWIGGVIRNSSIPFNVGKETRFRVEDNGQGANSPPDRMTTTTGIPQPVGSGHAQAWCTNTPQARVLNPVARGNLQVR